VKLAVTGGGTAGHVYPALSVLSALERKFPGADVLYLGSEEGIEAKLVEEKSIPFKPIKMKGLERKFSLSAIETFYLALKSSLGAIKILREFKPDAVFATGGYVSAPVLAAATFLRIPFLLHEQNAIPGLTNRIFSPFASAIAISLPRSRRYFAKNKKVVHTGNPVRKEIIEATRHNAISRFEIEDDIPTLLIFGGSQGSKKINQAFLEAYRHFAEFRELQIIHLTGERDYEWVKKEIEGLRDVGDKVKYLSFPYLRDMGLAYAAADLVVSRAGATTIAEITVRGLPAILIPYPYATANHQEKNARILESEGAARVILDSDLNSQTLFSEVKNILFNQIALRKMSEKSKKLGKPQADEEILKLILSLKAFSELEKMSEETEEEWEEI
jgi:UDP-N-acetylglucosamine--N-acetylmuramyl-(pentapeptide) pyrophosphoryl-undecaprenol N-acetylglucosamine transferase